MTKQDFRFYPNKRHLLLLAALVIAIYVLVPQLGDFRSSWRLLMHPKTGYTFAAVALTFLTFAAGSGTYHFLSFGRLKYFRTVAVQLAATFVNRLLPAGIGALGANYLYLRHERFSAGRAGSIVAANNLLGMIGHTLLVALILGTSNQTLTPKGWHGPKPELLVRLAILVIIVALTAAFLGRRRLSRISADLRKQLYDYARQPWVLLLALITSLTLTLCNVLCLYCCTAALGLSLPFASILLVFTFGLGTGSVVPTPGGLGGFEAGLTAGLVAYGIDPAQALAAALFYRLVSYWLPLIAGAGAFVICQRRGLFGA